MQDEINTIKLQSQVLLALIDKQFDGVAVSAAGLMDEVSKKIDHQQRHAALVVSALKTERDLLRSKVFELERNERHLMTMLDVNPELH